jgi:hypothetical protein
MYYYLCRSQVNRDYDSVVSLLVSDRLKSVLASDVLNHVLSVEQASGSAFMSYDKLADTVDLYFV